MPHQIETPVPILCYHRVVPEGMENCLWTLSLGEFERQIQRFAAQGYQTISLADFCRWQSRQADLPLKPLILTFDDGQEGFLKNVAPILAKYSFRATLFVIAGMLGQEARLAGGPAFQIMPIQEVAALGKAGFDIQSHGLYHQDWTRMGMEELKTEVRESVRILEGITGQPVRFAAYPYGRWNRRVRDLVEAAGLAGACTVEPGDNGFQQDRFLLKRHVILARRGRWLIPSAWYRARELRRRLFSGRAGY